MSPERSVQFRAEARRVLTWCALYTRGLDPAVAASRQDEIASDLHEHAAWAAQLGISGPRLARSVRARAVTGVAADLAWRRQQLRATVPTVRLALRINAILLTLVLMSGATLAGTSLFVIARVVRALLIGDIGYVPDATYALGGLALAAVSGSALITASSTRVAGTLLLVLPALFTLPVAGGVLWLVSASAVVAFHFAPWWNTTAVTAGIGLAAFCVGAAAYWWSADRTTTATRETGEAHV